MGFDERLWTHLVDEHEADLAVGPAIPARGHVTARRGVAAGAVVLAAAAAGTVVLARPSANSAWARQTIERAAAVVAPPSSPDTILHIAGTVTLSPLAQKDRASTVSSLSEEAWIQQGSPWAQRTVMQADGGDVFEEDSQDQIYDRTTNTVMPGPSLPSSAPDYTLTPLGHGKYRLSAPLPDGGVSTPMTIDAATVQAVHDGTDEVEWSVDWDGHTQQIGPMVGPSAKQMAQTQAQQPSPASTAFAAELHGLLDSGHARVTRTTTEDGRAAIEISSVNPQSGPQTDYYVDPTTYAPIELDTYGYDSPNDVTRLHISSYETMPLAGHQQLLHLTVPPSAQVDHSPAHYWQASGLPREF